uniref:Uncharacterized protein n=1 Tax=Anguilla anguilla TaxID=7936 RepID=A0A0E9UGI0_ANGAN
MSLVVLGN